ncbi:MAG: hypothetical protein IK143_05570 [Bacteroidales bacterium]|nr:hypothetical protein [Bacteroidales bacterium]
MTECLQIVKNISTFSGNESVVPERYKPVLERARLSALDESNTAQYINSMLTREDIQSYKNAAYEDGMEKGREEERIEIAKSMLMNGLSVDLIAKITALPVEQIKSLE